MKTSVMLIAALSVILLAGCGGGGGTSSATPGIVSDAPEENVVEMTIHQGAARSFLPEDVWGSPMSGRKWELYGDSSSPFYEFSDCYYVGPNSFAPGCGVKPDLDHGEWHVTHGQRLSATATQKIGVYYENFRAVEMTSEIPGEETRFTVKINVVADDYEEPSSTPANGEEIGCRDGAIAIKPAVDFGYAVLFPARQPDSIPFAYGYAEDSLIVVPMPESGMLRSGTTYVLVFKYGNCWEGSKDCKDREFRLEVKADEETFYCKYASPDGSKLVFPSYDNEPTPPPIPDELLVPPPGSGDYTSGEVTEAFISRLASRFPGVTFQPLPIEKRIDRVKGPEAKNM